MFDQIILYEWGHVLVQYLTITLKHVIKNKSAALDMLVSFINGGHEALTLPGSFINVRFSIYIELELYWLRIHSLNSL